MSYGHHVDCAKRLCKGIAKTHTFLNRHEAALEAIVVLLSCKGQPVVVHTFDYEQEAAIRVGIRVILEYEVFLHDAIGVGLFVCKFFIILALQMRGAGRLTCNVQR